MDDNKLKPDHCINRHNDHLNKYYTILLEVGLILSLMLLIGLTKISMSTETQEEIVLQEQEIIEMEEIIQTKQVDTPPPPPKQPVPVTVPNDEIIQDIDINIDAELDFTSQMELPPPPPQKEEEEEVEQEFFVIVEQMPELIGGLGSLQQEVEYPMRALRANIEGRVYVQFIVNERGEVEDPKVTRGIGGGCDEEALRVIRTAKFKPGLQRGRPVPVQFNLPIIFRIEH